MPSGCETIYEDLERRRMRATSPYSCASLSKKFNASCCISRTCPSRKCPRGPDGDFGLESMSTVFEMVCVNLQLLCALDMVHPTLQLTIAYIRFDV